MSGKIGAAMCSVVMKAGLKRPDLSRGFCRLVSYERCESENMSFRKRQAWELRICVHVWELQCLRVQQRYLASTKSQLCISVIFSSFSF